MSAESKADFEKELKNQTTRIIEILDHIQDPMTHPSPSTTSANTNTTAATKTKSSSSSSSSSSFSYQSLFSPLPSYESLDAHAERVRDVHLSSSDRYESLCTLLEMNAGDLVSSPQWESVLAAVTSCAISVFATTHTTAAASATSSAAPSKPNDEKKHTSFSHKRKHHHQQQQQQHQSSASNNNSNNNSKKETNLNSEERMHERFRMSVKAIDALRELYESTEEGSTQRADITLALVQAIRTAISIPIPTAFTNNHHHNNNHAHTTLQWLGAFPTDLTTASLCSYSPLVLSNTVLFQLCRVLTHTLHTIPTCWVYFNDEVIVSLMDAIVQLLASFHSSTSTSTLSNLPVAWSLFSMCDTRYSWLRRWVLQPQTRLIWHTTCTKRRVSLQRALDECWKWVKEYACFNTNQIHAILHESQQLSMSLTPAASISSNTTTAAASVVPLLSLTSIEWSTLVCTTSFAFLVEHLTTLISRTPTTTASTISTTSNAAAAATTSQSHTATSSSTSSKHQSASHKHKSLSHKTKKVSSSSSSTSKDTNSSSSSSSSSSSKPMMKDSLNGKGDELSYYLMQLHLRSLCVEFASNTLIFYTIHPLPDSPFSTTSTTTAANASTTATTTTSNTSKASLFQRLRLTLISVCVHLLTVMLPTPIFIEQSSAILQSLCSALETAFEPHSTIALSLQAQNQFYWENQRVTGPAASLSNHQLMSSSSSKAGGSSGMTKSRSQQDLKSLNSSGSITTTAVSNSSSSSSSNHAGSASSSHKKKKSSVPVTLNRPKTIPSSASVAVHTSSSSAASAASASSAIASSSSSSSSAHADTSTLASVDENSSSSSSVTSLTPVNVSNSSASTPASNMCQTQQCAVTSIIGLFLSFLHSSTNSARCKLILTQHVSLSIFTDSLHHQHHHSQNQQQQLHRLSPSTHSAFTFQKGSSQSSAANSGNSSPIAGSEAASKAVSSSGTHHLLLTLLIRWLRVEFDIHERVDATVDQMFSISPLSSPSNHHPHHTHASSNSTTAYLSVPNSAVNSLHSSPIQPKRKRIGFGFPLDAPHSPTSITSSSITTTSVPTTARMLELTTSSSFSTASLNSKRIVLSPTIKCLMIDLLQDCISLALPSSLTPLFSDLQMLTIKILALVQALPIDHADTTTNIASSSSATITPIQSNEVRNTNNNIIDNADESEPIRHQQSEQITKLLDLWIHWCSASNSFDLIHQSHPTILSLVSRRLTHQVRQHTPRSRWNISPSSTLSICLPWCKACIIEHEESTSLHYRVSDYALVQYERYHRLLLAFLQSEQALLALIRAGFIRVLFDNLSRRLREEDQEWSLSLELDEENHEPHESVSQYCTQLYHMLSLNRVDSI